MNKNGNGPTWKSVMLTAGTVIALGVNITWAMMARHEQQPHKDAVDVRELSPIQASIGEIKDDIREVRQMLLDMRVKK